MHLVELIPQRSTDHGLLDQLETFLVTVLGKGVVRARDTPNFVANRVGIFSMDRDQRLRLKPQNLLLNLPLARPQ